MPLRNAPSRAVHSLCSFSRTYLAPLTGLTHTEIARLSASESCSKTILARPSGDRFGAELYDTERLFAKGRQDELHVLGCTVCSAAPKTRYISTMSSARDRIFPESLSTPILLSYLATNQVMELPSALVVG